MIYDNRKFFEFAKEDAGVWINLSEFARLHSINGQKVMSVLTADTQNRSRSIDGDTIAGRNMTLYVKCEDISGITPGQSVRIDGGVYIVRGAQNIQDVLYKISLFGNSG